MHRLKPQITQREKKKRKQRTVEGTNNRKDEIQKERFDYVCVPAGPQVD